MGIFRRDRVKAEDFGGLLRQLYSNNVAETTNGFRAESTNGIKWPATLELEVAALLYFAYDYAMSAGPEKALRDRIRDGFLQVAPIPKEVADLLGDRSEEYVSALRSGRNEMLRLGNVFAKHTGHENNILVASLASTHYATSAKLINEQVRKNLKDLV